MILTNTLPFVTNQPSVWVKQVVFLSFKNLLKEEYLYKNILQSRKSIISIFEEFCCCDLTNTLPFVTNQPSVCAKQVVFFLSESGCKKLPKEIYSVLKGSLFWSIWFTSSLKCHQLLASVHSWRRIGGWQMYTLDTSPLRIARQTFDSCFSIYIWEKLCLLLKAKLSHVKSSVSWIVSCLMWQNPL